MKPIDEMMTLFTKALNARISDRLKGYVIVEYYRTTDVVKVKCLLNDVRFVRTYESGTYFAHNGKADYIYNDFMKAYRGFINRYYFKE